MSVDKMLREAELRPFAEYVRERLRARGMDVRMLIRQMYDIAPEGDVSGHSSVYDLVAGKSRPAPKSIARLAPALGTTKAHLNSLLLQGKQMANGTSTVAATKIQREAASDRFSIVMQQNGTVTLTIRAEGLSLATALTLAKTVSEADVFQSEQTVTT